MKRKTAGILLAVMVTALVGCGSQTGTTAQTNSVQEETQVNEDSAGAEETVESENNTDENGEADEAIDEESKETDDTLQESLEDSEEVSEANQEIEESNDKPAHDGPLTAAEVRDEMVFGWNLGNTLDAFIGNAGQVRNDGLSTETCWGNPKTTKTLIDGVKATGINVIRIPVTWYTHMDPSTYEIDPEWMARVEEVVNYALDDNTYVIINLHHDTGTDGWLKASDTNLDEKRKIYSAAWTQIAQNFADYDEHLLFEGFNEMLNDSNEWSNPDKRALEIVNEFNQTFVDIVRATGGNNSNRVLIVNSYCAGNTVKMLGTFVVPTDSATDAILAEVHAYTPYYFTAPEFPDKKTWEKGDVASTISYIGSRFDGLGIPVIIGEFGATPKNNDEQVREWAKYFLEKANYQGIKCIWWDNGIQKEYAIFDRNTGEASKPELLNTMLETVKGN